MTMNTLPQTSSIEQLIPVTPGEIGNEPVQTINARDLHAWLESKQKFTDWIKNRVSQYGFAQGVDFTVIPSFTKDDTAFGGQRKSKEIHISLDMAKELAMVERNAKGKAARQYFIRCEKQAKQAAVPQDYAAALRAAADAWERARALEQDNALLNTIIDNEFGYASIIRAATHLGVHETTFKWQTLKKATLESGLDVKRVPSPRFDYQNLYPIAVFAQCYPQFDFSGLQPEAVATRAVKLLGGHVATAVH